MSASVTPKSILITGCSSGIGYDAAHGLRAAGWRVFAACRKEADCARLQAEGFDAPLLDYTDEASIHAALAEVLDATGGRLDALFNNGAYGLPGAVEDLPTEALRETFETNFFGWHTLTRAVIPVMRAQGHGRIVQCSSVLGLVAMPLRGAYNASKFALEGLNDTLRQEMRGTGVEVILIEPGPITSAFRTNALRQFERWIDAAGSVRADQYERAVRARAARANQRDPFELPAAAVTQKLLHAVSAPRPRARYYVTTPTYFAAGMRRLLPTRALDWIMSR